MRSLPVNQRLFFTLYFYKNNHGNTLFNLDETLTPHVNHNPHDDNPDVFKVLHGGQVLPEVTHGADRERGAEEGRSGGGGQSPGGGGEEVVFIYYLNSMVTNSNSKIIADRTLPPPHPLQVNPPP